MYICVYLTSLSYNQSGDCNQTEVFAYCLLDTQRKCAENTFLTEEFASPVKHKKICGSLTVTREFTEFYLLLYAAYSSCSCFHLQMTPLPVAD
jgi:hypothetical protein